MLEPNDFRYRYYLDQTKLDLFCRNYFGRWLNIPAAGTAEILQFSITKFGKELLDISSKFTLPNNSWTVSEKKSPNPDIHNIFKATLETNIQYDTIHFRQLKRHYKT